MQYFHNAAATISYSPGGYIRVDWQPTTVTTPELRAIYEQVLLAFKRYQVTNLMTIHHQRPPLPAEVQTWLAAEWIPRAMAEADFRCCAVVEAATPLSRLAARAVGAKLTAGLHYAYFDSPEAAAGWLRQAAAV